MRYSIDYSGGMYDGRYGRSSYPLPSKYHGISDINKVFKMAVEEENLQVIEYALGNGADVRHNDDYGVRYASYKGRLDIVKYLVKNGANIHANNEHSLKLASEQNKIDVINYLIENGANVRVRGGSDILIYNINHQNLSIVEILLKRGIDVHYNDENALKNAYLRKNANIIKLLIKYGANRDIVKKWVISRSHDNTLLKLLEVPEYNKKRILIYD